MESTYSCIYRVFYCGNSLSNLFCVIVKKQAKCLFLFSFAEEKKSDACLLFPTLIANVFEKIKKR